MERKVRIIGTSQTDLGIKIKEHWHRILCDIYRNGNQFSERPNNDGVRLCVKGAYEERIFLTGSANGAEAQQGAFNSNGGGSYSQLLRVGISGEAYNQTTQQWSVDLVEDIGANYYKLNRATMADDTKPVAGANYGAFSFTKSIDNLDEMFATSLKTMTLLDYPNTFWDLSTFLLPKGQVALFNPGNGIHFFKDFYRCIMNVDGISIPSFSYQTIAGIGTFYVFGSVWIKDYPFGGA